jgi:membrane protein required for colicin V production
MAALGGLNRLLGAVLGGLKFALAISAIFLVIDQFSFVMNYFDSEVINESTLFKPVKSIGERVFDWLIDQKEFLPNQLV